MIVQTKSISIEGFDANRFMLRARDLCGYRENGHREEGAMSCSLPKRHKQKHKHYPSHNILMGGGVEFEGRCNATPRAGGVSCSLMQGHEGDRHFAHNNHNPNDELICEFGDPCESVVGKFLCSLEGEHQGRHENYKYHVPGGTLRCHWTCEADFAMVDEETGPTLVYTINARPSTTTTLSSSTTIGWE